MALFGCVNSSYDSLAHRKHPKKMFPDKGVIRCYHYSLDGVKYIPTTLSSVGIYTRRFHPGIILVKDGDAFHTRRREAERVAGYDGPLEVHKVLEYTKLPGLLLSKSHPPPVFHDKDTDEYRVYEANSIKEISDPNLIEKGYVWLLSMEKTVSDPSVLFLASLKEYKGGQRNTRVGFYDHSKVRTHWCAPKDWWAGNMLLSISPGAEFSLYKGPGDHRYRCTKRSDQASLSMMPQKR